MLKKYMAALVAVSMVWLPGCAGGMMAGPPPGYYNPHLSPNAVTRVTARNMAMTDELLGLAFPGYYNPAYYGYGLNNPYAWGGYQWAYDSNSWHVRRYRGDAWRIATVIGTAGALVLGGIALHKANKAEKKSETVSAPVAPARLPAEAPVAVGCYPMPVANLTGETIFVGDPFGEGFHVEAGQSVQACLLPTDRPYKRVGNSLVEVKFVREGNVIVIR